MGFCVEFVGEDELPEDRPWVMARVGGDYVLLIKESCVTPEMLEESWGAYEFLVGAYPPGPGKHQADPEPAPRSGADLTFTARHPERAAVPYLQSA